MFLPLCSPVVTPLSMSPGIRTFPEIAALLATAPGTTGSGTIKCDPKISHRAAFLSAKSISREGLMTALGLKLVPDEKGRELLKAIDEVQERSWAETLRAECSRQFDRDIRYALAAIRNGTGRKIGEEEWSEQWGRYHDPLTDPKVTPEEKRRLTEAWAEIWGQTMASSPARLATTQVLAAMPREVPMEMFETGTSVTVVPLANLPVPAIAALRAAYPNLQGGPGAAVVRKIILVDDMRLISAHLTLVDPSGTISMEGGVGANPIVGRTPQAVSPFASDLLVSEVSGGLKMRGYRAFVEEARAGEAEGRALLGTYLSEVPALPKSRATSLSQIAAGWAAKGKDVVMELSPKAEATVSVFDAKGLRSDSDWSPRVIEGTLVLRPLTRFLDARRRHPYAALRAYEAARAEKGDAIGAYVKLAGPTDRFGFVDYRGWSRCQLDNMAMGRRLEGIVPSEAYLLAKERSKPRTEEWAVAMGMYETGSWLMPLAGLTPAQRNVVGDAMRWGWGNYENDLAYSPAAFGAFLRHGVLRVNVAHPDDTHAVIGVYPDESTDPGSPWLSAGKVGL